MQTIKKTKYTGFGTFAEMMNYIKEKYDNKPHPNIKGHGFDGMSHYYEVEE